MCVVDHCIHASTDAVDARDVARNCVCVLPLTLGREKFFRDNAGTKPRAYTTCCIRTCSQQVQEAGDVLFVPSGWGHAVLNIEPSAAVAVELQLAP